MGFFGKSEAELKKIAEDLEKRQTELNNRESALASAHSSNRHERALLDEARAGFESEREAFRAEVKKQRDEMATESSTIEQRRLEMVKQEAAAKVNFVEKQREAFKEVIEKRITQLDARQEELEATEKHVADRLAELHTREAEIAKRELAVTEREQKADAGFADKAKTLADEAARQHQANQEEANRLGKQADALAEERRGLEIAKAELVKREQAIVAGEQRRDAGFADERSALDAELRAMRVKAESEVAELRGNQLSAMEEEVAKLKAKRLEDVGQAEQAERDRIRAEIASEMTAWTRQQEDTRKRLEAERTELEKQKGAVFALQSELEGLRAELERNEKAMEVKESRLERQWQKRNDGMDDAIADRLEEERQSMESMKRELKAENDRLRESLRIQIELVGAFDQLKQQLGDRDPAEILRELNSKTDELKRLRDELATRPTEEERARYQEMAAEAERQRARVAELVKQCNDSAALVSEAADLRRKNNELDADNKMLSQRASRFEGAANEAQAELERLRAAYERPAEVAARYKEIELPHVKAEKIRQPKKDDTIDELTWLTGVGNACDNYGLHFHPRILRAFHTALKTAEWSPVTILAGVSGTGKSELPRLYSHFGGLMFEPLSVQPNWDSQESMLGFFNSIDNKFDAQAILRFLAQSQKPWTDGTNGDDGYPGLQNAVCLVLLDEMNLAHPELYFAEFLSKLELRRGMKGSDVPFLPVKIGAGLPPYQLPLGRNVLWTGTMNQDETTKSLSDKVLDRSIIIHFPRPTELKRRLKLAPLDEKNRGPLLHKVLWQSWLAQGTSFSDEEVKPFKDFIQEMNKALAVAGRAIGHRVWQSVEYYMANYPDVRAAQQAGEKDALDRALHTAFEDQLVQKVMPKLRGIDTRDRSKGKECLDKILDQINTGIGGNPFNLAEDFSLACELGYGQFIWQSANYLTETATDPSTAGTDANANGVGESGSVDAVPAAEPAVVDASKRRATVESVAEENVTPPDSFMPTDPSRNAKWVRLSKAKKQKYLSPENDDAQ